jgi:hypothetical protein
MVYLIGIYLVSLANGAPAGQGGRPRREQIESALPQKADELLRCSELTLVWGGFCQGVPRGAYRFIFMSVSLFDLD